MYKRVSNPIRSTADTTDSSPAATVRPPSSSRPYLCTTTSTKIVPGGEKDSNLNYINDAFIPPLCHHSVAIAACSICFSLSVYTGKKKRGQVYSSWLVFIKSTRTEKPRHHIHVSSVTASDP